MQRCRARLVVSLCVACGCFAALAATAAKSAWSGEQLRRTHAPACGSVDDPGVVGERAPQVDVGARIRADAADAVRGSVGSELWREQVEDGNHETITVSG